MGVYRDMRRLLCKLLTAAMAALCCACGTGTAARLAQPEAGTETAGAGAPVPDLPSPQALARQAAAWNYAECHGADFMAGVAHNRIEADATLAVYSPAWRLREHHPLIDLAYGVYALQAPEFNGVSKLSLLWHGAAPAAGTCWVGLGNQHRDRWDWYPLPAGNVIHPQALVPYETAARQIYVAVALLGEVECALNGLWIGDGTHLYYEVEDNDTAATADLLTLPFEYVGVTGSVGTANIDDYDGDGEDWYTFYVDAPAYVELAFSNPGTVGQLWTYRFYRADAVGQPELADLQTSNTNVAYKYYCPAGQYWLQLTGNGNQYKLRLAEQPWELTEVEDNDSRELANALHPAASGFVPVTGSLGQTEDELEPGETVFDGDTADWFSFEVAQQCGIELHVETSKASHQLKIWLLAGDGNSLLDWQQAGHAVQGLRCVLPEAGRYYIKLEHDEYSHTNYSLQVDFIGAGDGWASQLIPGTMSTPEMKHAPVGASCKGLELGELPALFWTSGENDAVWFSRCLAAGIAPWTKPALVMPKRDGNWRILGLFKIDGCPALVLRAQFAGIPEPLLYLRAKDSLGQAWFDPVAVSLSSTKKFSVFTTCGVQDAPAVCAVTDGIFTRDMLYFKALDGTGTAWNPPVVIDTVYNGGDQGELGIVDGHPAVAYSCYTESGTHAMVRYVRAKDAPGTEWAAPQDVFEYILCNDVSMDVWSRGPVIYMTVFGMFEPQKWLVRAADAAGQAWNPPADMRLSAGNSSAVLKLIDSLPRVAWSTNYALYYSYAEEYDGSAWAYGEIVAAGDNGSPGAICIFDVKSQPVIAYYSNGLRIAYRF